MAGIPCFFPYFAEGGMRAVFGDVAAAFGEEVFVCLEVVDQAYFLFGGVGEVKEDGAATFYEVGRGDLEVGEGGRAHCAGSSKPVGEGRI
jgi:hypothetical protein